MGMSSELDKAEEQGWLEMTCGKPEWHITKPEARVMTAANSRIVIDKLYGPLCASEVSVTLEYADGKSDWVVHYRNPTTELWEEKARWDCQENCPEDS
jgi:hypothetical protein